MELKIGLMPTTKVIQICNGSSIKQMKSNGYKYTLHIHQNEAM